MPQHQAVLYTLYRVSRCPFELPYGQNYSRETSFHLQHKPAANTVCEYKGTSAFCGTGQILFGDARHRSHPDAGCTLRSLWMVIRTVVNEANNITLAMSIRHSALKMVSKSHTWFRPAVRVYLDPHREHADNSVEAEIKDMWVHLQYVNPKCL